MSEKQTIGDQFLARFWYPEFLRQDEVGQCFYGPERMLHRLFAPILDHLRLHWQFWLNWLVAVAAATAAVVTLWVQLGK